MACRRERCSGCGMELAVPLGVLNIRCAVCRTVTRVRPSNSLSQSQDPVRQAANWVRGFLSNINSIAAAAASFNSYSGPSVPSFSYYPHPSRPLTHLPVHGRKRALLCGVSYRYRRYELKGTINDVNCMRYFLTEKLGFPNDSILVLTEDENDPLRIPTKQNIRMALQWLIQGCRSEDSLVFHYSGHGSQQPNLNGEEVDGYDETLCPLDYETEGMILDDEINVTIVRPLPKGATLHAIVDACHSGTVLDLPFVCRMNREGQYIWENQTPPSGTYKGTAGGLALCFSACDDHQTSADTSALAGNTMTGALTYCFIHAVESEPGLSYGRLLNLMRCLIRESRTTGFSLTNGPIASLIRKVFRAGLRQV
uniref:Metacaspase-1-like n=1 Tax=Nelumbo nucifera TaxID=4432 RepID=A0A822ZHE7_NELNU|nr:TPA_asm: hypothetical protein HUJ06_015431 [Nelumbo nucifera]